MSAPKKHITETKSYKERKAARYKAAFNNEPLPNMRSNEVWRPYRSGIKGASWNPKYTPLLSPLLRDATKRVGTHHVKQGARKGMDIGAIGGAGTGSLIAALLHRKGERLGPALSGAILGGGIGGATGLLAGAGYGGYKGHKAIRAVTTSLRRGPQGVKDFQKEYPKLAADIFPTKKEAKKLRKRSYIRSYLVIDKNTGKSRFNTVSGPSSVGWAKHGYVREDLIEAIIDEVSLGAALLGVGGLTTAAGAGYLRYRGTSRNLKKRYNKAHDKLLFTRDSVRNAPSAVYSSKKDKYARKMNKQIKKMNKLSQKHSHKYGASLHLGGVKLKGSDKGRDPITLHLVNS